MSARGFFDTLAALFSKEQQRLNDLDAAIGDGDHGSTMARGFAAAKTAPDGAQARAFMRASGGASGTLFGLILHEIELYLNGSETALAEHLQRAEERIRKLGKTAPGDKSMVDSLAPAVTALKSGRAMDAAVDAANQGREATIDMAARSGRARYVENAGRGHVDPGATSVCLILGTLIDGKGRI